MLKIYKASAGSGKTYTLAYEYIKALLGIKQQDSGRYRLNSPKYCPGSGESSNRHRFILAITFTNKATEEMKRRIIDKLDALSALPEPGARDADYAEELCREYGCTRAELAEAAGKALRQLLNLYSSFNVATIDSFFQRVLRTFARELDRQGDFSIELNDRFAVQTAVNAMLDDFNRGGEVASPLGRWIVRYVSTQLDTGGKTNFFNRRSKLHTMLVGILTNICEETFKPYEAAMKEYLAIDSPASEGARRVADLLAALRKAKADILVGLKARVTADLARLADAGVTLDQLNGRSSLRSFIEQYCLAGKAFTKKMLENKSFNEAADGVKDPFTKKFRGTDADRGLFASMLLEVKKEHYRYYAIEQIEEAADSFALLAFAWRYLKDFSADNNTVLLSDTGSMLNRIIGRDDTPFIYERMGVNLRNFLIDEFQDTSRMQWANLMPLVRNGLGEGHDSLIIGDEKQSIYRFRNSDPSLLHTEVETIDFPADQYGTSVHGLDTRENTNWRSASDIVLFNNTLFTILTRALGVDGFGNVVQAIAPKNVSRRGYVEFVPVSSDRAREAMGDAGLSDDKMRRFHAVDLMASRMMHQHDVLGYSWSQIAVLVNTNKEGALAIDRLLAAHPGIPVMSEEALYVKKSPAVQLIIGVLKLISAPDAGDVPPGGFPTPTQLARTLSRVEYYRNRGMTVDEALDEAMSPSASDADSISVGIDAVKRRKPASLPALVETIIHEQLSEAERHSQVAYLTAFMDYVTDYCSKFNPTLRAFLGNWETTKDKLSVSSASDVDAVKVMTIHKSKGLEFDCVHIPFGSWDTVGKPRGRWIPFPEIPGVPAEVCPPVVYLALDKWFAQPGSLLYDEYEADRKEMLEDTMNKTYVAYTRASEQLIVYYNPGEGIGECIADAMLAGYQGDEPYLTDISRFYTDGAFRMGDPDAAGGHAPAEAQDPDDSVIAVEAYKVSFNESAQVVTRVADVFDFASDDADELYAVDDAPADVYADEDARQRGIMLHDVLSRIDTVADIDRAVGSYSAEKGFTSKEKADLLSTMREMLLEPDERLNRWFDADHRAANEQAVYVKEWDKVRRIDRLVFLPDGSLEVVDYKFTAEPSAHHRRQVAAYINILRRMGHRSVRGYLWYPFRHEIVEVTSSSAGAT